MSPIGDFNPNSAVLLGSEWRPTSQRNVTINGSNAIAQRFRPGAVTPAKLDAYVAAVAKQGLCLEIVDTLTPTLDPAVTVFPSTDTGASLASWKDEAGAAATFAKINKNTDDTTYLQNVATAGTASTLTFRAATAISAGKRVIAVQPHMRVSSTIFWYSFYTAGFDLSIGGTDYQTATSITSDGQFRNVDGTALYLHPVTGIPWSLTAQTNVLCNGTDRFGVYVNAGPIMVVSGIWLTVLTCAENRRAFFYQKAGTGPSSATWTQNTLVGINGGAIGALSANTWYYIVVWAPGNASFTVPALLDSHVVLASVASGAGEHRQTYTATTSGSGVLSAATANPGEMIPMLLEAPAATFNSQSQPYGGLSPVTVDSSVTPGFSEQITSPGVNPYVAVRVVLGWANQSQRPNQPLTIEVRHGGGASTGGGTLDATATVAVDDLTSGEMQDWVAFFTAFNSAAATQYFLFFRSAATAGKGWSIGRLDTVDSVVSGVTTANIEGTGVGGSTDSYADTGGTARSRYDLAALIAAAPTNPAGFTATVRAAL